MSLMITTRLTFRGDARPALAFHRSALGGQVVAVTRWDSGDAADPDGADQVRCGPSTTADGSAGMAHDAPSATPYDPDEDLLPGSVRGADTGGTGGPGKKPCGGATVVLPPATAAWAPPAGHGRPRPAAPPSTRGGDDTAVTTPAPGRTGDQVGAPRRGVTVAAPRRHPAGAERAAA